MRVMVLGGGVVGTASAWYLARAGFRVTVVDRQPGAGLETSYGNAGQISPGYASPWAAPGIPLKALRWLFQRHAPLAIRPGLDPLQYLWLARMLGQCSAARYAVNKARMVRIAEYSRDCLDALCAETGIRYEQRRLGTLQLFRTQAQLDGAARDVAVLERYAVPYQILGPEELLRHEPALARARSPLAGALRLPRDQTGDCHLFTQRLAELARGAGVEFRYGQRVDALHAEGGRIAGVGIDGRIEGADRYVLALGSDSPRLLAPLGLRLPVYPLKGYSLTVSIADETAAPRSTVLDETHKVAITRFDRRVRVGGMAELCGFDLSLSRRRRATLQRVVGDLYPGVGDLERAEFWAGLRPATPDGTPIVGATPFPNLFTNTGHGTLGWTMACGSGRYLADLMAGRRPAISGEGLDLNRYARRSGPAQSTPACAPHAP